MSEHVLLIHGWSATDKSMAKVGTLLTGHGYETRDVYLGGYPSMDDDVRIEDSGRRLHTVIADLQAEAIATGNHAAALIERAMTAAGHAATALNADEEGDAA